MILPVTLQCGHITAKDLVASWSIVFIGNFLGAVLYAALYAFTISDGFTAAPAPVVFALVHATYAKTLHYAKLGAARGFAACFCKAVLCNWMVCMGVLCNMVSSSAVGKVLCCWLPVVTFFAQGFEHLVVNMFVIPCGMMLGSPVTIADFCMYNLVPVIVGNIIGGYIFVGLPFLYTFGGEDKNALLPK